MKEIFSPISHLTKGWRGDGLYSKEAIFLKNFQNRLAQEALSHIKNYQHLPNSIRNSIFNEFNEYVIGIGHAEAQIKEISKFLSELNTTQSSFSKWIEDFCQFYAHRLVTLYFFKIRFVVLLAKEIGSPISEKNLLNPQAFISKIFPASSSKELPSEALSPNKYSWFRPKTIRATDLPNIIRSLEKVTTTDLMKIATHSSLINSKYSHSLSHSVFGQFINTLLIFFPQWLRNENQNNSPSSRKKKILGLKFSGDYLSSLALSHWKAQEADSNQYWHELLAPEFIENNYIFGHFEKLCQELHFLSFLIPLAKKQGHNPISLICQTIRERNEKRSVGTIPLLSNGGLNHQRSHDRVVLNLVNFPKTNQHHYLIQKIIEQKSCLIDNGLLYVFSGQNLFVPSKAPQVAQLLNHFDMRANFSFEEIQGKGELPSYLYIFSLKRNGTFNTESNTLLEQKTETLTFRLKGELTQFQQLGQYSDSMANFFQSEQKYSKSFFHKDIDNYKSFNFHRDAITNGLLLHTSLEDQNNITHPAFFSRLTKNSVPLDNFFSINAVDEDKIDNADQLDLIGLFSKKATHYDYLLIVDFRDPDNVQFELTDFSSLSYKKQEYGTVYFRYFGLMPKVAKININHFREYFQSHIGTQVIQLAMAGGIRKAKAKIRTMLIPTFFKEIPASENDFFNDNNALFKYKSSQILQEDSKKLFSLFEQAEQKLDQLIVTSPWTALSALSLFKTNLSNAIELIEDKRSNPFESTYFISELKKLKTEAIYPYNEDVYINFKSSELKNHLTKAIIEVSSNSEQSLNIYSDDKIIAKFYGSQLLLEFMAFVLTRAKGLSIISIIQSLRIPSAQNIELIYKSYSNSRNHYQIMIEGIEEHIQKVFQSTILKR